MSLVIAAALLSCGAERLARTTACPNRSVPSGEGERVSPSADPSEKVALIVAPEIAGPDIGDASLVNVAGGDTSCGDEVSEPLRGKGVPFVVIDIHALTVWRGAQRLP